MPSATGLPSLSGRAPLALPPMVVDFGLPPSVPQAVGEIKSLASQLRLNRVQFKRIESMCLAIYQNLGHGDRTPGQRLLLAVRARCPVWQSADLLKSLVLVPKDMDKFERHCINLGASQTFVPSAEDNNVELEATAEAVTQIISNEQDRSRAMDLKDLPAEIFVSHLQMILHNFDLDRNLREEYIKALRKLAVGAEVLPSSLKIEEVILNSAHPIASGGFADIFQGKWEGKIVAIKRPRIHAFKNLAESLKQWRREMLLWHQLSHEFVLPLLGVFKEDRPIDSMVSEWMDHGTLKAFLTKSENEGYNRLTLIHQVSGGLEYLHTHAPPVAHGDIKAENIYMGPDMRPRIGDFGLSYNYYNNRTLSSTLESGSVRWMAPEILKPDKSGTGRYPQKATLESDVWAFGMLMLELFTDKDPYDEEPEPIVVMNIVEKKILPARPRYIDRRGLTDAVWTLMVQCWNFDPVGRPKICFVVRNLHRLVSLDIQHTARESSKECVEHTLVPVALVDRVVTSDGANWKTLDVKVAKENGYITKNGTRMAAITITGNTGIVAEARLRIDEAVQKFAALTKTEQIHIPKQFHGRLVGKKGCNVIRLQKKHGVHIEFPTTHEQSTKVKITGSTAGVEGAKVDFEKMVKFERSSRDVIKVTPRAAELISLRLHELIRPPLREMNVDASTGTVTLRGKREGIIFGQTNIQAIEDEVAREVTEEISVDRTIHDMIKSDPQTWIDIVDRCGSPVGGQHCLLDIFPDTLRVRGVPEFVGSLRNEISQLLAVGNSCVTGKRISSHRQESLMGSQGELVKSLRKHTKAMLYFPKSGGYTAVGMPNNMDRYEDVPPEDIVKVVGSPGACAEARDYLEDRVEEKRKKEHNPEYHFPAGLHHVLQKKLANRFRSLGISVESERPATPQSILSFISDDSDLITATGPDSSWSIHERHDRKDLPLCKWRLEANSITRTDDHLHALRKAGDFLTTEVKKVWRRIGVLWLRDPSHLRIVGERLEELGEQDKDVAFELVDKPDRVVVAGPSSDKVEAILNKVVALVESSGD